MAVTEVLVGGEQAQFTVVSPTELTFVTPAGLPAGPATVVVHSLFDTAAAPEPFVFHDPATITSFTPTTGPAIGGTVVTVTGDGFTDATGVQFGSTNGTAFVRVSATTVRATSPAHAAGAVKIKVLSPSGDGTSTGDFTYAAAPVPGITSFTPATGPTAGGTLTTITGTNLTGTTGVRFDTALGTGMTVVSATSITVTSPAHAAGTVKLTVENPNGNAVSTGNFTYTAPAVPTITSFTPAGGSTAGGTVTTVTGTNLTGTTAVAFDTTDGTAFSVVNATTVRATSPAHAAGAVKLTVKHPSGNVVSTGNFTYATPPPTVTSFTPNNGPAAGGTVTTVTGTNLTGATGLLFGTTPGTAFSVVNATTVRATSPAHATGNVSLTVQHPAGNVVSSGLFAFDAPPALPPTMTAVAPLIGPAAGGTTVTITGTNFTGTTAVDFFNDPAEFTVVNATTITAVSPGGEGMVQIRVTNTAGYVDSSYEQQFRYAGTPDLAAADPGTGPAAGGTVVTFYYDEIYQPTSITFGGVAAVMGPEWAIPGGGNGTATSPAHAAGPVEIVISTPFGDATLPADPDGFTYE